MLAEGSSYPCLIPKECQRGAWDARGGYFLTLELAPRTDTQARPFRTHSFHDCIDCFEWEVYPILGRTTVLIRPLIGF